MSFGCGVTGLKMSGDGSSTDNKAPVDKACKEFGDERESKTENLDRSRSHLNTYAFPDGIGSSGDELAHWFIGKMADANVQRKAEGKRPYTSQTLLGATFVITPNEEEVAKWDAETRDRFVRDAIDSLAVWIGHPPDAYAVHVDEGAMRERGLARDDELGEQGLHIHVADRMLNAEGNYDGKHTLHPRRFRELHKVFPAEMKKRGWDIDPHKSVEEHRRDGDERATPGGLHANAYRKIKKWEHAKQREIATEKADAAQQKAAADAATAKAAKDVEDAKKKTEEEQEKVEAAKAEKADAEKKRDAAKRERKAYAGDEYRTKGDGKAKGVAGLKKERDALKQEIAEKKKTRDSLASDVESKTKTRDDLDAEIKSSTTKRDEIAADIATKTKERDDLDIEITRQKPKLKNLDARKKAADERDDKLGKREEAVGARGGSRQGSRRCERLRQAPHGRSGRLRARYCRGRFAA